MTNISYDADIAIIGYGPSGVAAANFLGSHGVRAIALERAAGIYQRARAVTIDDWTMRCFQSVGLDDRLKTVMDVTYALRWITYDGEELRRMVLPTGPTDNGHAKSYSIYQPSMEEILRDGAARYADTIEVRYGVEVAGIAQDDEGVTVTTNDVTTGASGSLRTRYALACDGGSSMMRERLGIPLLGDTHDTKWVVIDARVKKWWPDRNILTFWSDKDRPVVDIALAMGNHRWELPLAPHETEADFETPEQLWRLLGTMGVTPDNVEIHQHAFYKHHIRRAERWRDGRVFLIGDSAHLMPPWAGQGMQSGIRDAHNVAWKLAAVLDGRASDALLDSYQPERAPDVARCTMMAVGLGYMIRREIPAGAPADAPPPPDPVLRAGWIARSGDVVGKMMPQPRVASANGRIGLLDMIIGNGLVLIGDHVDPRTLIDEADCADWDALGATYRTVRGADQSSETPDDIVDIDGALCEWMRANGVRAVAVRPDYFIAASDISGFSVPGAASTAQKAAAFA